MSTPLIDNEAGHILTNGAPPHAGPHCLDAYLSGGKLYLKVTLNGRNPGGGEPEVSLHLNAADAQTLIDALTRGVKSI